MAHTSANFAELLEVGLREVFFERYDLGTDYIPTFYSVIKSETVHEYDIPVSGFTDIPVKKEGDTIDYEKVIQGTKLTYTHSAYAKGFSVSRELADDELYGFVAKNAKSLGLAFYRTRQKKAASIFNNAFNVSVFPGRDGLALCSNAHTAFGSGGNQDNFGTSALSFASLEATRIAMEDFRDENGELIMCRPNMIAIPPNLESTARELIESKLKPGGPNNDINVHEDAFKYIVWPWLSESKNWFMVDTILMRDFLLFFNRIYTEFGKAENVDIMAQKYWGYMRFCNGFSDWRWVYGHQVA